MLHELKPPMPPAGMRRRACVAAGMAGLTGLTGMVSMRPAFALAPDLRAAIDAFTGGAALREGKIEIEVAALVENGNVVPIAMAVDSPMTGADHVRVLALFNERNPQRDVARFTLGPRAGRARVSTRIRLATSQQLVAVAVLSDGSHWTRSVDVVVTLAACIE
jgi:sulfur-oxidizing protein SoxY